MANNEATGEATEVKTTKRKKLNKDLTTKPGIVIITIDEGEKGAMEFPFSKLPPEIQKKFGPFGLGHKLGDAAAGKAGKDAEEAIHKVYAGLLANDWSVRAPAAPKINVSELAANYAKLGPKEQMVAKKFLTGLGLNLPGITS